MYAPPRSFSQLTTSFFASQTLGIHHTPLFCFKTFIPVRCCISPDLLFFVLISLSQYVKELVAIRQFDNLIIRQWFAHWLIVKLPHWLIELASVKVMNLQTYSLTPLLKNFLLIRQSFNSTTFHCLIASLANWLIVSLPHWLIFCGGYRSRTDDPLRARQML